MPVDYCCCQPWSEKLFLQWAVVNEEIHNSLKCRRKVRKNARARGRNEVSSGNNLVMALLSSQRLGLPCKIFIIFCFYFLKRSFCAAQTDFRQVFMPVMEVGGTHESLFLPEDLKGVNGC